MKVIEKINEIKERLLIHNNNQESIILVPTMGALHDGHLTLVKEAKKIAKIVVVSIFVNKAQFNNFEDFEKYPRNLIKDIEALKDCGINYIFAPSHQEIFQEQNNFEVNVLGIADCLCGRYRPKHFNGVALIISKLFNIIKPNHAIFGMKDFQQLLIIKKLVNDFNFSVKIHGFETVRNNQGLALSSRNQRLNNHQLLIASNIFRILNEIKNNFRNNKNILMEKKQELLAIGFDKVEYLEIRDENNLQLIENFQTNQQARIFIAVYLQGVRLIDNLAIS
ncbi:pantothenate synthetase [Alphaproteobacteria bacterium]|nr:pantothenate synthetase [Alphaproteobacteria bacterium]